MLPHAGQEARKTIGEPEERAVHASSEACTSTSAAARSARGAPRRTLGRLRLRRGSGGGRGSGGEGAHGWIAAQSRRQDPEESLNEDLARHLGLAHAAVH